MDHRRQYFSRLRSLFQRRGMWRPPTAAFGPETEPEDASGGARAETSYRLASPGGPTRSNCLPGFVGQRYDSRSTEVGTLGNMIYHYDCDRCGLHRDLRILPREYRLGSDRTLQMKQRHLWCAVCNDISVCESLTPDEDEQKYWQKSLRELRSLRDNPPADLSSLRWHERVEVEFAAKWIQDIEQAMSDWHEWRSCRKAPSHCLRCGVPVEHVPLDMADLSHVGCGGMLKCTVTIRSSCGPAYVPHVYTVDGVLLKAGRKPNVLTNPGKVDYFPMELFCSESDGYVDGD